MSSYQKFDTSVIRKRIKDGAYPTLAGANRAIGKTQGLSEDDKTDLKKYAAKHFGADAPAAAPAAKKAGKKASKKAAAKPAKAAKKASKKTAKKASKRAPKAAAASDTEADTSESTAPAVVATEAAPAPRRRGRAPAVGKPSSQLELPLTLNEPAGGSGGSGNTLAAKATLMGNVIGTCDQMLRSITMANNLIPKEVAAEGSSIVAKTMTRAVQVLDRDVVSPLLQDSTTEKALAPKAKRTPPPKPKNPTTTASVVAAATPEEIADSDDGDSLPLEALEAAGGDDDEGDTEERPELTEEERLSVEALRETMPHNLPAGLRVPGVNSTPR
jgi:hypothetical protein